MLRFELGEQQAPRGHAILYARVSGSERVVASYCVVLPITFSIGKYLPPMFAGQFPIDALNEGVSPVSAMPIPPMFEDVESLAQVSLSNQAGGGVLHYTLDGSLPGRDSPEYHVPLAVKLPATVRVVTLAADGSMLAAPRQRMLSRADLLSVGGNQMPNCPGSDFRLRVQPLPDATSLAPVYSVNLFNTCQLYPSTPMDGIATIRVDAVRLERNYALAHEAKLAVAHPHATPFGELVVHQDRCDGPVLASMPLPDPARSARNFALRATLPSQHGEHALCLLYTAPTDGPLYALDRVALLPEGVAP